MGSHYGNGKLTRTSLEIVRYKSLWEIDPVKILEGVEIYQWIKLLLQWIDIYKVCLEA